MTLGPLARVELACHDPYRQGKFYQRVFGLDPAAGAGGPRFAVGGVELVLRQRGDALFPVARTQGDAQAAEGSAVVLAFRVPAAELDRWHRRMLMARVAVLEAPGLGGSPPRRLRIADPEGHVIELFVGS